jgi:hypothetical protein
LLYFRELIYWAFQKKPHNNLCVYCCLFLSDFVLRRNTVFSPTNQVHTVFRSREYVRTYSSNVFFSEPTFRAVIYGTLFRNHIICVCVCVLCTIYIQNSERRVKVDFLTDLFFLRNVFWKGGSSQMIFYQRPKQRHLKSKLKYICIYVFIKIGFILGNWIHI